jgi:hypothetical protein
MPQQVANRSDNPVQTIRFLKEAAPWHKPVGRKGLGRCVNDRKLRVHTAAVLSDVPSVERAGQSDVREEGAHAFVASLHGLFTSRRLDYLKAGFLERLNDNHPEKLLILDYKESHRPLLCLQEVLPRCLIPECARSHSLILPAEGEAMWDVRSDGSGFQFRDRMHEKSPAAG